MLLGTRVTWSRVLENPTLQHSGVTWDTLVSQELQ